MPQKGEHTWDLNIQYHRCPECGFIIENREDFEYLMGNYVKQLKCDRCQHLFTETKEKEHTFGPLIGEPQPIEWEWKT